MRGKHKQAYFQTIKSILKNMFAVYGLSLFVNFQTIKSILKQ